MNLHKDRTFILKTLGCKVNQYESLKMRRQLERSGFISVDKSGGAGFCIINSCTVTHRAEKDVRRLIRQFVNADPGCVVVVCGCSVELKEDADALANLHDNIIFVKNTDKQNIARILTEHSGPATSGNNMPQAFVHDRNRAFLKIQDGCDNSCSYCKVSVVRGRSRSRPMLEILEEAKHISSQGHMEIVLTGICMGSWGKDLGNKTDLTVLLKEIAGLPGKFRIRLSSVEPKYVTESLIDIIAGSDRICKHLHIPVQSGDDVILNEMHRGYKINDIHKILGYARKRMPDHFFTTDIIVGFPGESPEAFGNTCSFISDAGPLKTHIFTYSKRNGTAAAVLKGKVPDGEVKQRVKVLTDIAGKAAQAQKTAFLGKKLSVLIESERDRKTGMLCGYSDQYIHVLLEGPDSLMNNIAVVRAQKTAGDDVFGVIL